MISELNKIVISSKYLSAYTEIIERSISRIGGIQQKHKMKTAANRMCGYVEAHHIIPKSIAPELRLVKENLAYLTPREHFICHLLLERMFRNTQHHYKMLYAVRWLSNKHNLKSAAYNELKVSIRHVNSASAKERLQNPEFREKFFKAANAANKIIRDYDPIKWAQQSMGSTEGRANAKKTQQTASHRKACSERELNKSTEQRLALAKQGQQALVDKLGGEEAYRKYLSNRIKGRRKYINPADGSIRMLREAIDGYVLMSDYNTTVRNHYVYI
jgi:hypothetical protein